jgi:hypothetical protein
MENARALVLDCDDVLLDWVGGFIKWYKLNNNAPNLTREMITDIDFSSTLGCTTERLAELCRAFNESDEFATLDSVNDNDFRYLLWLMHCRFDIFVLTKCGTSDRIKNNRIKNFSRNFINMGFTPIKETIFLDFNESKAPIIDNLTKIYQRVNVVDDNIHNLNDIHALGYDKNTVGLFLFDRIHNQNVNPIKPIHRIHRFIDIDTNEITINMENRWKNRGFGNGI